MKQFLVFLFIIFSIKSASHASGNPLSKLQVRNLSDVTKVIATDKVCDFSAIQIDLQTSHCLRELYQLKTPEEPTCNTIFDQIEQQVVQIERLNLDEPLVIAYLPEVADQNFAKSDSLPIENLKLESLSYNTPTSQFSWTIFREGNPEAFYLATVRRPIDQANIPSTPGLHFNAMSEDESSSAMQRYQLSKSMAYEDSHLTLNAQGERQGEKESHKYEFRTYVERKLSSLRLNAKLNYKVQDQSSSDLEDQLDTQIQLSAPLDSSSELRFSTQLNESLLKEEPSHESHSLTYSTRRKLGSLRISSEGSSKFSFNNEQPSLEHEAAAQLSGETRRSRYALKINLKIKDQTPSDRFPSLKLESSEKTGFRKTSLQIGSDNILLTSTGKRARRQWQCQLGIQNEEPLAQCQITIEK